MAQRNQLMLIRYPGRCVRIRIAPHGAPPAGARSEFHQLAGSAVVPDAVEFSVADRRGEKWAELRHRRRKAQRPADLPGCRVRPILEQPEREGGIPFYPLFRRKQRVGRYHNGVSRRRLPQGTAVERIGRGRGRCFKQFVPYYFPEIRGQDDRVRPGELKVPHLQLHRPLQLPIVRSEYCQGNLYLFRLEESSAFPAPPGAGGKEDQR